jgi:hypothetical protein
VSILIHPRSTGDVVPLWWWRVARLLLFGLVLGGGITALLLANGAADPPRAGSLWAAKNTSGLSSIQVSGEQAITRFELPERPFTLEISALFADQSDPLASWAVVFDNAVRIEIYVDAYFSVAPFLPNSVSFFHIKPAGKANELYLNVSVNGEATLRINREIAWQGQFPAATYAILRAKSDTDSVLRIERIDLYASVTNSP